MAMHQIINQNWEQDIMSHGKGICCLKGSLALIFMLIFQYASAQEFSQADQFLVRNQKAFGNELVVVVQKDGKPVYKKELGKDFNLQSTARAEELTQWFVAATALQLNDEGKMKLDDPLAKYIPRYEQYMKGFISVRHALTHTHGLDAGKDNVAKLFTKNSFDNLTQENDVYITKRDIRENPGEMFDYSRMGLAMAARAMEASTKKTLDRLIVEKLFRPIGMRQSTFSNDNGKVDPFSGAYTSGQDFLNFAQMLLNKGTINGKRILSEDAVKELLKPQMTDARVVTKPDMFKDYDYCLTTWVAEKDGNGNATLIRQGLGGTQAVIDFASNTIYLILLKDPEGDKKKALTSELMQILTGK
jgi:CubicO group peptidase (beta-lactamase class C family)